MLKHWFRRTAPETHLPAPRVKPSARRAVQVHVMGERSLDVATARDISSTGVSVYLDHPFEGCDVNSVLELILTLPGTRAFRVRGKVRHVSRPRLSPNFFGCEFVELNPRCRAAIDEYVRGFASPAELR